MACKYWHMSQREYGVCYGTKNAEQCYCEGDTSKCDFFDHIKKRGCQTCSDVKGAAITCSGERQPSMEQEIIGSAVSAEAGRTTANQKERMQMKDKRFVLNLHLEKNEELMAEIDHLIRERVKMIIREEAEKMIGGAIQEESVRVAKQKLAEMRSYDFRNAMIKAIETKLNWDHEMRGIVASGVKDYMRENSYTINRFISEAVNNKLSGSLNEIAIKAVADALLNR